MSSTEQENAAATGQPENIISDYYESYQQQTLQSVEAKVKKARNAIYVVAALTLIGNLIVMGSSDAFTPEGLVIVLFISGIFFALGWYTKKQPLISILIALALYLGLWILDIVVVGSEMIYKGILVKAIILYFLITGIGHARQAERIKKDIKNP